MKKLFLIVAALFITGLGCAQKRYGSNNGKFLTIKGTKLYYEEYGSGMPLLLLHGGFGSISDFSGLIPQLSKKYRVIIPDAPAHGRSDFPYKKLSYQVMAEYYSVLIDQLKLKSLYVMGWSDGANSGLLLAHKRPEKVKKIVVSGANFKSSGYKGMEGYKKTIFNLNWVNSNWQNWINHYSTLTTPKKDWKRFINECKTMWLTPEYFSKETLKNIKVPVLVVYGDNDSVILEHGLELKNAIKNSQLCVLPNTSHNVFGEKKNLVLNIANNFFNN